MKNAEDNPAKCWIWGTFARIIGTPDSLTEIDSPRTGGKYRISIDAYNAVREQENKFKIRLTNWLVNERLSGSNSPEITESIIRNIENTGDIGIVEQADRVLQYLSEKSERLGDVIKFYIRQLDPREDSLFSNTPPEEDQKTEEDQRMFERTFFDLLAYSGTEQYSDLLFLLKHLENRKYIEITGRNDPEKGCILTVQGYSRLEELKTDQTEVSDVFVAMWFDDSMDDALEQAIEPAISKAGYNPIRIDKDLRTDKIDDAIIGKIRRSRFVVADFTQGNEGARGGVYYEAGFAHGLNKRVFFTCKEDSFDNVHFDTRQYSHIIWNELGQLKNELYEKICAVIGEGPLKKNN